MTWTSGTLYGFDVESTGTDVFTDRIVTATVVKIVDGAAADMRTWLIDPGIEIPEAATNVHGITTDRARAEGVHPSEALPGIRDTIAGVLRARIPLVAFNAAYDLSILESELRRWDLQPLTAVVVDDAWHTLLDPFVLAKGLEHNLRRQYVKGRTFKLPDLCKRYRVPFEETHDATADATGAGLLAIALGLEEPMFTEQGPARLHQLQKTWRRGQADSLRAHFEKNGIEHDGVDGSWPLHSRLLEKANA